MIAKNSLLLLFFSLAAHFFNYLYHLVGAKFLTPVDFGLLQSFVALNYFLGVFASSYSLSIIKFFNTSQKSLKQLFGELNYLSIKLTSIVWMLFVLTYPLFKILLHLENPFIFFLFSLQFLFIFFPRVYSSVFLAKLKFFHFSLLNIFTPILKLALASLFLLFGFRVFGAILSLILTTVIGTLISLIWVKRHFRLKFKFIKTSIPTSFYSFFSITLITQFSLTSLYSSDILLVRYYFPTRAGIYSTASLLARVIFFLSASVLTVTFSVFAQKKTRSKVNFAQAFILVALLGTVCLIAYSLFPTFFIKLLATEKYLPAADLLIIFSLFMLVFSLFNLVIQFLLNYKLKLAGLLTGSVAIVQIILIILNHASLKTIIFDSLLASIFGLTIGMGFVLRS